MRAHLRRPAAIRGSAGLAAPGKAVRSTLQRLADASDAVARLKSLAALAPARQANPLQRRSNGLMHGAQLLQRMPKPVVENERLGNVVNSLFKGAPARGRKIGDGSAMAAANAEVTGAVRGRVGGRDHVKKMDNTLGALNNILSKHYNRRSDFRLSAKDVATAKRLRRACMAAKAGTYRG